MICTTNIWNDTYIYIKNERYEKSFVTWLIDCPETFLTVRWRHWICKFGTSWCYRHVLYIVPSDWDYQYWWGGCIKIEIRMINWVIVLRLISTRFMEWLYSDWGYLHWWWLYSDWEYQDGRNGFIRIEITKIDMVAIFRLRLRRLVYSNRDYRDEWGDCI